MTMTPDHLAIGHQLSELIGAVGLYLGHIKSAHEDDRDRLHRAARAALHDEAFVRYMIREEPAPAVLAGTLYKREEL